MPGSASKNRHKSATSNQQQADYSSDFEQLNSKLDIVINEISKTNKRLDQLEHSQKKLEQSVEYLHEETKESKSATKELECRFQRLSERVDSFKNLESRLKVYEYNDRARCVELNGIPYAKDENLFEGLNKILKQIKLTSINVSTDIDKVY